MTGLVRRPLRRCACSAVSSGLGSGRNIQALYAFLCRNLRSADDEIHLFGFSRGAFTVRILAGLIHHEGVRPIDGEAELGRWVRTAYRRNRLRLALAQVGPIRRAIFIVGAALLGTGRRLEWREPPLRPKIDLVGVWDTVAAYGGPIIEMVRGFDRWVWPLSMPDYKLSDSVRRARHALSLDEEREAFLPLPWDEVGSERPERIRQVWFAGVHSDVGGGYADDSLSSIALAWMLDEAKAAGLAFLPAAEEAIRDNANAWGPMHDSRSGLAVAYRYQPRSINALMGLTPNSPQRDPESGDQPLMGDIVVHNSVLARIHDPDGYAPIVLPTEFGDDRGRHVSLPSGAREAIWTHVRRRQRYQRPAPDHRRDRAVCTALRTMAVDGGRRSAPRAGAGSGVGIDPAPARRPTHGLCRRGDVASGLRGGNRAVARARRPGARRDRHAGGRDVGEELGWGGSPRRTFGSAVAERRSAWGEHGQSGADYAGPFCRRCSGSASTPWLRLLAVMVIRQSMLIGHEMHGDLCPATAPPSPTFATAEPCHRLGFPVLAAHRYRVRLAVEQPWFVDGMATSPTGFTSVDSMKAGWSAGGLRGAL